MVLPGRRRRLLPSERDAPWDRAAERCLVRSRELLLDALEALEALGAHLVVGGGQAVDLRLHGDAFPPPPWTQDADVTLDLAGMEGPPPVAALLAAAGFVRVEGPGHWALRSNRLARFLLPRPAARLDVLVPEEGHDLSPFDGAVAAVEPMVTTLLDDAWLEVPPLDPHDGRRRRARVAGLGSLLLTKAHKFHTRYLRATARGRAESTIGRKDAHDVRRLLLSPGDDLERDVARVRAHPRGARVAEQAIGFLALHFATPDGVGSRLAVDAGAPPRGDDDAARARRRAAAIGGDP